MSRLATRSEGGDAPRPPQHYSRLSIAAKQQRHLDRMREPAIACPYCEAQTTVDGLLRHVEATCPGKRPPHPLSKWVTASEIVAMGVPRATVHRWVQRGIVQMDGPSRERRYLLRDVVRVLALTKRAPRRGG